MQTYQSLFERKNRHRREQQYKASNWASPSIPIYGSLMPIENPRGWSKEADICEFIDTFGESKDYFGDVKEEVQIEYQNLCTVLDAGLNYFLDRQGQSSHMPLKALSLSEKVEWLHTVIGHTFSEPSYIRRFTDHLVYCSWVDGERRRLLNRYRDSPDKPWLACLVRLSEELCAAAMQFEEGMICESADFHGPLVYHSKHSIES